MKKITAAALSALLPVLWGVTVRAEPPAAATRAKSDVAQLLATAPKASDFPNAARVMLLDLADITVRPDGSARTVTRQAIRVFNKRGRDAESEIQIPYNSGYETVKLVRARTIRPDGTVAEVKLDEVREASPSEYDDARVKSFSMPAVDDNAIIEYEYITDQKASALPGYFWTQWYFQGGFDPVQYTRLTVTIPKSLDLHQKIRYSAVTPSVKDSPDGKNKIYTWEDKNVAPFDLEPMMPDVERMRPKLTLSTLPGWQTVAAWYAKIAQGRDTADAAIQQKAQELTRGLTRDEDKAKAIFYYVEDKTRYVAIELGLSAYQPRPASRTLANQYGDCKDMATLLVSMLRSVGISAYPVLLRVQPVQPIQDELPAPSAFNHAICLAEIDGKKYWLDATAQMASWGQIPGADRGADAFVIRDGKGVWEKIPLADPDEAKAVQTIRLTLSDDGSAKGTVELTGTGDNDLSLRSQLLYLPPDRVQGYLEQMARRIGPNARVTDYKVSDFHNRDVPVSITMQVTLPNWATRSGSLLLFKARPDQSAGASSNPFEEGDRRHPIAQTNIQRVDSHLEVTLPAGFALLSKPDDSSAQSPIGRYERSIVLSGSTLTIKSRIDELAADLPASTVPDLRQYYDRYLRAWDEPVIVKK